MNQQIEFNHTDNQLLNDSIDRIVVELHNYKKRMGDKTILMSGCGTQSGTTTISIQLAIALSLSGWKTLLVDCDLRKGTIEQNFDKIDSGLSDYLSQKVEKESIIYETNYELLNYIPRGNQVSSPVQLFCSSNMEQFVNVMRRKYDYIIFDFPSVNIVSDANILFPYVDGIVLVVALEKATKRQLQEARRKVQQYKDKYYGIIVNQVDLPQYKTYRKDYDYFKQNNISKGWKKLWKKFSRKKKGAIHEK